MSNTINNDIPMVPENTTDPASGTNIALNTVDALLHPTVMTVNTTSPPAVPVDGQRFIVGPSPTGAWAGQAGKMARWLNSVWSFYTASYALNLADGRLYGRPGGGVWGPVSGTALAVKVNGNAQGDANSIDFAGAVTVTSDGAGNIVLTFTGGGGTGGMDNPMTTLGDIIVAATDGDPVRLPIGTENYILRVVGGVPTWAEETTGSGGGIENPLSAAWDIFVGGLAGAPGRLPIGTEGQVLTVVGGELVYVTPTGGGGGLTGFTSGVDRNAPNDVIPLVTLAVDVTEDNGSVMLPAKGSGAMLVPNLVGDPSVYDLRGNFAIDLQRMSTNPLQIAKGAFSSLLGGQMNGALGQCSTVVGGQRSTATGDDSGVFAGSAGEAKGRQAAIVGGDRNVADASQAVVIGGSGNQSGEDGSGSGSAVIGGDGNKATGNYSAILGGSYSVVSAQGATVVGGSYNKATAQDAAVIGGNQNKAEAQSSVVVGGYGTTCQGMYAGTFCTVNGTVTASSAVLVGGTGNKAGAGNSVVIGGMNNETLGATDQAILGGQNNQTSGPSTAILGGDNNTATNYGSISMGGRQNDSQGTASVVVGGMMNQATADFAVVLGGMNNLASAPFSVVIGGQHATTRSLMASTARSSGNYGTKGDTQYTTSVQHNRTGDATPTMLGAGGSPTELYTMPPSACFRITVEVLAKAIGGSDCAAWTIDAMIVSDSSGAASIVGTPSVLPKGASAGASAWAVGVALGAEPGTFGVQVTGDSTSASWIANFSTLELVG